MTVNLMVRFELFYSLGQNLWVLLAAHLLLCVYLYDRVRDLFYTAMLEQLF